MHGPTNEHKQQQQKKKTKRKKRKTCWETMTSKNVDTITEKEIHSRINVQDL